MMSNDIRAQHVALTEPGQNQAVTDDMPMVTWINYGVHGAESSGMDASLPTVYYLAAAQGATTNRVTIAIPDVQIGFIDDRLAGKGKPKPDDFGGTIASMISGAGGLCQ